MKQRQDQEVGMDENTEPNEGRELARRVAKEWVRDEGSEFIPLSVLALDHPEPLAGWEPLLEARGIELLEDDLYRPAIRREDARALVQERREWERESAEKVRRLQESLEALSIPAGIPALQDGSPPLASLMAHDPGYRTPQAEFGRPAPRFLEEELEQGARQQAAARAEIAARKGKDR